MSTVSEKPIVGSVIENNKQDSVTQKHLIIKTNDDVYIYLI